MATVMALVWPCHESTVEETRTPLGRSYLLTRPSTMSTASSTAWLRVARMTISGSLAGAEESTRRVDSGLPVPS